MARIVYSALVESIAGSIKGTTFQKNAYGFTVKGKPFKVNPNTNSQRNRKASFSGASVAWKSLSNANKANWETYAATFPIPSRLNPTSNLNGFNAFTRWHNIQFLESNAVILSNPSAAQGSISAFDFGVDENAGVLTFNWNPATIVGTWRIAIFISRPQARYLKPRKGWTRYMQTIPAATATSYNISANYVKAFGFIPPSGVSVLVKLIALNTGNGQLLMPAPIYADIA